MAALFTFKDLNIDSDEFEIRIKEDPDGGATLELEFNTEEAEEIFRAACARAGISREEYIKTLVLGDQSNSK